MKAVRHTLPDLRQEQIMRTRARRAIVSIASFLVVMSVAAFRPPGAALCEYGCGIEWCPDNMEELCLEHCATSIWVCGASSWCGGELGYHCGPL